MQITVQKYGGKSVATISRIKQVAKKIVKRQKSGEKLVVVVSAMSDTTDRLLEFAKLVSPNPPERELDMLLTAGERISMALLSMAIWCNGGRAISFTGSQSGIITDDNHTRARIVEIRANRIIEELNNDKIVIVAGFQGVSGRREITTLGRGGSDTTAVALACALGADVCEIYSDVDGIYSADPKKIKGARHIDEIDYETLFDMTFFGAKVVHSRAVEMARKFGVKLVLASSMKEGNYTMVKSKSLEGAKFIAVSSHPEIYWIEATLPRESFRNVVRKLDELRTNLRNPSVTVENENIRLSFWILPDQLPEVDKLIRDTGRNTFRIYDAGLVAASGYGIAHSAEAIVLITEILEKNAIPYHHIGTTNQSVFIILPKDFVGPAEKVLHKRLIAEGEKL
ncbi:MAG TPA: aspartate kinase [candidate division Zixibacteria bacterium]|nr:aspartate kinase [candidate division Zixibacteria bacterium]